MSVLTWSAVIGTVAALCTTLAFLPQLVTVWRRGGRGLSSAMLSMYLVGMSLWLVYGLVNHAGAVIAANAASIVLVAAVAVVKRVRDDAPGRRRLRIAIDMDEVMADALSEHLDRYNRTFGARLTAADVGGRHLEECIPAAHRQAAEALLDASFFENLAVFPDCQAVIRELAARHDVYIVTAAMDVPCSFDAKYRWLQRHFPFISPSHIVFCGDKSIVDADYLIDDRARHFERFKGRPLLFSAPHNAHEHRYPRVDSWLEVREVFARLDAESAGRATMDRSEPDVRRAPLPESVL
jgi:5'(3')-deoxyribonucleotidase/uncharacterized protein with PQ loop repeat